MVLKKISEFFWKWSAEILGVLIVSAMILSVIVIVLKLIEWILRSLGVM
jgi:hypothetical protein